MWYFTLLAGVTGAVITLASLFNSTLTQKTGLYTTLAYVSGSGFLLMLCLYPVFGRGASLSALGRGDGLTLLGGVLGLFIVAVPALLFKKIGAFETVLGLIVGQLLFGMLVDSLGLLGNPRLPLTPTKLVASALLLTSFVLLRR